MRGLAGAPDPSGADRLARRRRVTTTRRGLLVMFTVVAGLAALAPACNEDLGGVGNPTPTQAPGSTLPLLRPLVQAQHPHDAAAYTQGLEVEGGHLYESTGLRGRSSLREVDLTTGEVLRQVDLPSPFFGEGIALVGDRIIQLTWQERTALVYDVGTFAQVGSFSYDTEGWGLCFDGTDLIMSDGTDRLLRRDPETFEVRSVVQVTREGVPQTKLNELECVEGRVWANVYQTDTIVEIDPASGQVVAVVDAAGLLPASGGPPPGVLNGTVPPGVLNGIAYDERDGTFLLTGKNWPALFAVTFVPSPGEPGP